MSILLDGSLAARLTDALVAADLPYALTVQHGVDNGDPFNPETTWVDHSCTGWVDDYSLQDKAGTLIQVNDRKVFILCNSLDLVPTTADKLVVSGSTYQIINVALDPASTCWVVQARK
ncbi:hypothetical protein Nham_2154 [Nitrobacter hamburgensis X14]|uniref:Uncharacterized protein n=1 Tax=Nitrobacter hamburgensis (strain DSM 10229 / NCIMB 13809 / X14) TaxID=323097 RepID=Q1QLE8_NITHX|nr:hypothetical protein [Nitrobacter hamburgensis]ABE62949.1 hypothetical protein Nham_2154 [Nitrobacter hamburgensis X14]